MILQALYELYDRLKDDPAYRIAPPGYSSQKIAFKIVIRPDGGLFSIEDVCVTQDSRKKPQQMTVLGGAKPPGSGLNPCFLWDNTAYMLGFVLDDGKPDMSHSQKRAVRAFEAFRDHHIDLEGDINDSAFTAVCSFLKSWSPKDGYGKSELAEISSGFGVFQILGEAQYVHQKQEIQHWWESQAKLATSGFQACCLISGRHDFIAPTHNKIKGVFGAQSAGAAIVSFNEPAYESYGKHQSLNAPVSEQAVFKYTTALNALLDGSMRDRHRITLGDATIVFWTEKPSAAEDVFAQFSSEGSYAVETPEAQDESIRKKLQVFLKALRQGQEAYGEIDDQPSMNIFSLLALAPNAARLSVRFFYRGTIQELLDNLRNHFNDIAIHPQPAAGKRRADPEFPPAWLLLRQTARDSKEIPPILGGALLRSIITGSQYPAGLFAAVIRRIHADREINYARVCVIKGYLVRNLKQEVSMSLDIERSDPAYRVGRLFAALEKTQADALGSINASIRDRFYSSASATPRSVFPRLLRTYQHHLGKLSGGHKVNREKLIQEIIDPLEKFPAHLNLADQGLFAIGYYHQIRFFYTKKSDNDSNETKERTAE